MKIKNIIILTIFLLAFVLIIPITNGKSKLNDFDPTKDNWYKVEPWEIEYCRKWGGSEEGGLSPGASSGMPIALSQMTVTLQGEKITYPIENQSTLYKVSWYIEPAFGDIGYAVLLVMGDEGVEISAGTASNSNAGFGYYADYINMTFTHARIEYPGNYLEVPLI